MLPLDIIYATVGMAFETGSILGGSSLGSSLKSLPLDTSLSASPAAQCINSLRYMETIVQYVHCIEGAYVYGGYVRDYIVNLEVPRDLDVSVPSAGDLETLLRMISCSCKVTQSDELAPYVWPSGDHRGRTTVRVSPYPESPLFRPFLTDITVKALDSPVNDFTCNILAYSRVGLTVLNIPRCFRFEPSPVNTVLKHVRGKTFMLAEQPQILTKPEANRYSSRLCRRAISMIDRGWTMLADRTNFVMCSAKKLAMFSEPDAVFQNATFKDVDQCTVCLKTYEACDVVVLTRCNHHFHGACIAQWLDTGRSEVGCPVCRNSNFLLNIVQNTHTRFGDDRADAPLGEEEGDEEEEEEGDEDEEDDEDDEDYEEEYEEDEEEDDGGQEAVTVTFAF